MTGSPLVVSVRAKFLTAPCFSVCSTFFGNVIELVEMGRENHRIASGGAATRILLPAAWLLVLMTALLNGFRLSLHSDMLFQADLFRDLFDLGGAWSHWRFTPAPAYVPDTALNALAYLLLVHPGDRILLVTILQILILAGSAIFLARQIMPDVSKVGIASLLIVLSLTNLVAVDHGWFYHIHNNVHVPTTIFGLLCLGVFLRFIDRGGVVWLLALGLGVVVAVLSGSLFILAFVVPMSLVGLMTAALAGRDARTRNRVILATLMVLGAFAVAKGLEGYVTYNDPLLGRASISRVRMIASLNKFLDSFELLYRSADALVWIFLGSMAAALLYSAAALPGIVQFRRETGARTEGLSSLRIGMVECDGRLAIAWAFLLASGGVLVTGSIISGGYADEFGLRYLMLPGALVFLLSLIIHDRRCAGRQTRSRWSGYAAGLCLVGLGATGAAMATTRIMAPDFSFSHLRDYGVVPILGLQGDNRLYEWQIAACLDDLGGKHKLRTGISDYWHARGVQYQTRSIDRMIAVQPDLRPFFWMSTVGPLIRQQHYGTHINFVITARDSAAAGSIPFLADNIEAQLPSGYERHRCEQAAFDVFYYSGSELHDFMMKRRVPQTKLETGLWGESAVALVAADLPGIVGHVQGDARTVQGGDGQGGVLTFGPYADLSPGKYVACVDYQSGTGGSGGSDVGSWDFVGVVDGPETFFQAPLKTGGQSACSGEVSVPRGAKNVEVRTFFNGVGDLSVSGIALKRIDSK
ncbi:hypothetical protein FW320_02865 [Azospirillum sp. Vi22]|nr:hypothetical protein [Azospirillum baldaniorum]